MYRAIIWGTGKTFNDYINLIKYHEMIGNIKVIGVVSNTTVFEEIAGYKYISKENVKEIEFDVVIYMGDEKKIREVKQEAMEAGVSEEKLVLFKMLTVPGLHVEKYMEMIRNPLTIFANNCWGGVVYNRLGLEFSSPLVNMYESNEDYIKFLKNPEKYLKAPLILHEEFESEYVNGKYPICKCDDILLYFNHYNSFEKAKECWETRKKRINMNNVFAMFFTLDKEMELEFSKLPYKKKICFVPYPTDIESSLHLEFQNKNEAEELPFWRIVNSTVNSDFYCYDLLELVYSGKLIRVSK